MSPDERIGDCIAQIVPAIATTKHILNCVLIVSTSLMLQDVLNLKTRLFCRVPIRSCWRPSDGILRGICWRPYWRIWCYGSTRFLPRSTSVAPILNGENIEKAVFVASPIKKPRYKNCNVATFGGGGN